MKNRKLKLYPGLRISENKIELDNKPIHVFKNEKEFDETSGIYAFTFYLGHPLKNLVFYWCFEDEDIAKDGKKCSYGFMEDEEE